MFPAASGCFGLEQFHVQGSRILSRSFTIPITRAGGPAPEGGDDDDDEDEEDEVAVMVPMADMLNAAYERDNARLFADGDEDEEDDDDEEQDEGKHAAIQAAKRFGEGYTMITTKAIEAGEQIVSGVLWGFTDLQYNTYASPPNSELLRKYGHVDALPLSADLLAELEPAEVGAYPFGNAGDEVELQGDLLVSAAVEAGHLARDGEDGAEARIDWWLEEGQADAFSLLFPTEGPLTVVPPALWAFARLLTREEDWARAKRGKLPKPKEDEASVALILAAIRARAVKYPQTLEVDVAAVGDAALSLNARNAAAVRIGEKRILALASRLLQKELDNPKRKAEEDADRSAKRSRK